MVNQFKGAFMIQNGHTITGIHNRIDTRLLDGEKVHTYVSLVDVNDVAVIGLPMDTLLNFVRSEDRSLKAFNSLLGDLGKCDKNQDIFAVAVSETLPLLCLKLFGEHDFVVVTTHNVDGVRFSIFDDKMCVKSKELKIDFTKKF